jgi:hypothetical protein
MVHNNPMMMNHHMPPFIGGSQSVPISSPPVPVSTMQQFRPTNLYNVVNTPITATTTTTLGDNNCLPHYAPSPPTPMEVLRNEQALTAALKQHLRDNETNNINMVSNINETTEHDKRTLE